MIVAERSLPTHLLCIRVDMREQYTRMRAAIQYTNVHSRARLYHTAF